jgi:hypothetical protein
MIGIRAGDGRQIWNPWIGYAGRTMIKLVSARVPRDRVLRLTIGDGNEGDLDLASILVRDTVLTRPRAMPEYLGTIFLALGALCRANGLEFSARSLYAQLKQLGALRHRATA